MNVPVANPHHSIAMPAVFPRLDRMEHLKRSDARIRDLNGIL